jgi:hypothetical protein
MLAFMVIYIYIFGVGGMCVCTHIVSVLVCVVYFFKKINFK